MQQSFSQPSKKAAAQPFVKDPAPFSGKLENIARLACFIALERLGTDCFRLTQLHG